MAVRHETRMYMVSGMSCPACEQRIEKGISKLPGIVECRASYASGSVKVVNDASVTGPDEVMCALNDLGYPVTDGGGAASPLKTRVKPYFTAALILAVLIAGFMWLSGTGVLNNFPMAGPDTALSMMFVIGLITSVHCVAMCGGLSISQCAGRESGLWPSVLYNVGRVVAYTTVGAVVGAIGMAITPPGSFRGVVAILGGVFMLVMGLNMTGAIPWLRRLVPRMPRFAVRKADTAKAGKGPFVVGLLTGLMPCGPLQAMQLYALSSGSPLRGALAMFLFSLGTVPLMFGLGALSGILGRRFSGVMMKVSAVLVILLGMIMLSNGLALSGIGTVFN